MRRLERVTRWLEAACLALDRLFSRKRVAIGTLIAIFLLAAVYHAAYAVQMRGFQIMTDELQYLKLGLNLPHHLVPQLHGEYFASYNQLYPLLIAPFGLVIQSIPPLFLTLHVVNGFAMASVVFPTYLLAREVRVSRLGALVAAAIAVAGPWLVFTSLLMTENVAYPAFVWGALGIQRALALPSLRRDMIALAGIGLAASARTQFAALLLVFLAGIFLERAHVEAVAAGVRQQEEAFRRGLRAAAAEHRQFLRLAVCIAVIAGVLAVAFSPNSVVGIYGTVFDKSLVPNGLLSHMREHAATLTTAYGVLPMILAFALVLSALRRPVPRETHAFAWLFLLATLTVLFISSSFNISFSAGGLNDRYLFYVLPLVAVGAVAALADRTVSWQAIAISGVAVAVLVRYGHYSGYAPPTWVGAPSSTIDPVIGGKVSQLNNLVGTSFSTRQALFGVALAVAAALAFLVARRRGPVALVAVGLPVLAWLGIQTQYQYDKQPPWNRPTPRIVKGALHTRSIGPVDWIDKIPGSRSVALVPSVGVNQIAWWQDEFFNRDVDKLFRFENPVQPARYKTSLVHYQLETLFHDELRVNPETGAFYGLARNRMTPWLVTSDIDARLGFAGTRRVAAEPPASAPLGPRHLIHVDTPYRAAWLATAIYDDGWTAGQGTPLLFFGHSGKAERWKVRLQLGPTAAKRQAREWSIRQSGGARRAGGRLSRTKPKAVRFSVCVGPGPRPTRFELRAAGTEVLPDERTVGLQLISVEAASTGRPCSST